MNNKINKLTLNKLTLNRKSKIYLKNNLEFKNINKEIPQITSYKSVNQSYKLDNFKCINNKILMNKMLMNKNLIENKETSIENDKLDDIKNKNNIYNKEKIKIYIKNEYNIIFGLTCHENILCVKDLIDNISKFCELSYLILISCTENLYKDIINFNYDNVIITNIRNKNNSIWGKIDLFYQHIINMGYLINNNINYKYYWFLASNELFIRPIKLEFIEKNMFKILKKRNIKDNEYNEWYNNFIKTNNWYWFKELKRDSYTMNCFKKNKIYIKAMQHEGLVLENFIISEIYNEYNKMNINMYSTNRKWVAEEIFISSYLYSKYILDKNILSFTIRYNFNNKLKYISDPKLLVENVLNINNILSLKPIKRDYNDRLRVYIRKNLPEK